MGTLLAVVLGIVLIGAVYRYFVSAEKEGDDPHLGPRVQARTERLERYERLPDRRKVAVTCVRECGDRDVDTHRIRHRIRAFGDAARARHGDEVTVPVVLGPLHERERKAAARRRVTLIDVDRLESWMRGTALSALAA